jgi:hypothetical protein
MSSEAAEPVDPDEPLEESPFDEDDEEPGAVVRRPWLPAKPLTQAELDHYANLPWEIRTFNPWACMFNRNAEDGIGWYSGMGRRQCETLLADPTKSRYCLEHARQMGVDYYSPPELTEAVDREVATNLTRLVPKAVQTLEDVMDDMDAPQGVRAKAADSVLDRTGFSKGVDIRVDAQIATVDITGLIKDRLDALKDMTVVAAAEVVDEVVDEDGAATVPGDIIVPDGDADRTGGRDGDGDPSDGGAA